MKKENPFCADKFDFLQFFKYKIKTFFISKGRMSIIHVS